MRQLKISASITLRNSRSIDLYFTEISKLPLLTSEEEVELCQRINDGDQIALSKLVKANLRFVVSVAKQYARPGKIELSDLINEGNIGLIFAAQKFDHLRGFKFISYAVWWIRQRILLHIGLSRSILKTPMNAERGANLLSQAQAKLFQQLEREPTDEEIMASEDFLTKHELVAAKLANVHVRSLSENVNSSDDITFDDLLVDSDSMKAFEFSEEHNQFKLGLLLNKLNPRERKILSMRFGVDGYNVYTYHEIGEQTQLSVERVRQIVDNAVRKLRTKQLKEFMLA